VPPPEAKPPSRPLLLEQGGFEPYLRALRRHPLIVAAVTIAAVAGTTVWLALRPVSYDAIAQVLVTPVPSDDPNYLGLPVVRDVPSDPTRVFQSAAAMLDSPAAAAPTAQRLGDGWTAARVRSVVTVQPLGESNVVAVQASAARPTVAATLANTFIETVLAQRQAALRSQATALLARISGRRTLPPVPLDQLEAVSRGIDPMFSLLHLAVPPRRASGVSAWRALLLSLIPGFVLGTAAAMLADLIARRRVRWFDRFGERRVDRPAA